jgi:flavin reductase (DIM6/NTAB) family NADH-FMN oxidoreductase RutF
MTITEPMIDSASVKRELSLEHAYRLIACGPVTLVTSFYRGDMNVMTASWLTPVSYRPVLIGLSVHQNNLTHDLIKLSGEFAINVATPDLLRQVDYCGRVSGRDQNKLQASGLHEEGPHHIRPILIRECIAHLECAVVETVTPGDHTVFIAQVVHAQAEEEVFEATYVLEQRDLRPLHHLGGDRYAALDMVVTPSTPAPPRDRDD